MPRLLVIAMTAALLGIACTCTRSASRSAEASRPITTEIAPESAPESAPEPTNPGRSTEAPASARGMWVWGTRTRLTTPGATEALLGSCRRAGINELYLSVNGGVLDDARLPELMASLAAAGIRVEALIGEASWSRPEALPTMLAQIDAVAAYTKRHPEAPFVGVHLDVEPHQLPENKGHHGFLPALADALRKATARAASHALTSSADLPRFALAEHGPAFAGAVGRVFVMLYELRASGADALVKAARAVLEQTASGAGPTPTTPVVVGLRVEDYPHDLETMLEALPAAQGNRAAARYGGWAIHDEAKYRARRP